jgi:hypothetical protein
MLLNYKQHVPLINTTLQSNILGPILDHVISTLRRDTRNLIRHYLKNRILRYIQRSNMLKLKISISVITVISKLYSLYIKNLIRLNFIIQDKYPLFYNGLIVLYLEYCCIFKGKLSEYHLYLFLVLGFFSNDSDYFD